MLFNSYIFWIFFGFVFAIYGCLCHRNRNRFLVLASYFFYGYWDWRFLGLIALSTLIDFYAAKRISDDRTTGRDGKHWLIVSLVVNLGLLGIFKYLGFFIAEFGDLLVLIGFEAPLRGISLILPVGISFYTFQTLSYTIDVYRGRIKPTNSLTDFAVYVSFFPQLVAGPIERSEHLLPQVVRSRPSIDEMRFREGLYFILSGLFRKVVIADNMALIANQIFSTPTSELDGLSILIGVYAFAFQIYGDFSGYSSIAQGTAKWLGFDLMDNFRHPYFARSPRDFWQRWHISLSTWLRDYLYIPLGGNRLGRWLTYRNLMITMLLGGLWHGAAWTFVVWGGIHGVWLAIHRGLPKRDERGERDSPFLSVMKILGTFHLVCLTWLFFRAESIEQAIKMLCLFFFEPWAWSETAKGFFVLLGFFLTPLLVYECWVEKRKDLLALTRVPWFFRLAVYLFVVFMLLFFGAPEQQEFIYFRF